MGVTFRISKIGRKFGQRVSTESCDPDSQVSRAPEESESNRSNREIKGSFSKKILNFERLVSEIEVIIPNKLLKVYFILFFPSGHCFRALLKAMVVNFCSHLYLKYLQVNI